MLLCSNYGPDNLNDRYFVFYKNEGVAGVLRYHVSVEIFKPYATYSRTSAHLQLLHFGMWNFANFLNPQPLLL